MPSVKLKEAACQPVFPAVLLLSHKPYFGKPHSICGICVGLTVYRRCRCGVLMAPNNFALAIYLHNFLLRKYSRRKNSCWASFGVPCLAQKCSNWVNRVIKRIGHAFVDLIYKLFTSGHGNFLPPMLRSPNIMRHGEQAIRWQGERLRGYFRWRVTY